MFDKDLIEKICNLSCLKSDVCRNQTEIKYDSVYPFKKYYDVNIIIGAINKYLSKEWDASTFSSWCCIYNWIICGGFNIDLIEDLNPFEEFYKEIISWDLDGLSFYDEEEAYIDVEINKWIEQYKNWDHIWQTRNEWQGVYSPISKYDRENGDQYVVVFNDKRKEYMILFSEHLNNNYCSQNEYLKYTTKSKLVKLINTLQENKYSILSCFEEFYYSDLSEIND